MKERIQKIIAASGLCSRRAAEQMISEGRVTVNGKTAQIGDTADGAVDIICVDKTPLTKTGERCYILLNKPRGYVTTMSDDKGRQTVAQLTAGVGARVYPVGRLDYNSEGLLIMTDDGELANHLMHPSHQVKKTYHVRVKGENLKHSIDMLQKPMVIDGTKINTPEVKLLDEKEFGALISITINQGLNRQVRKMCDSVGLRVMRLKRVAEGGVLLGELPSGHWRFLTASEIANLQK